MERCLSVADHSVTLTASFAKCLKRSKQLSHVARLVFGARNETFAAADAADEILRIKNISAFNSRTAPNLRLCLRDLNGVNRSIGVIRAIRDVRYNSDNANHEERLERLWRAALYAAPRWASNSEWQEIDFRAMILRRISEAWDFWDYANLGTS